MISNGNHVKLNSGRKFVVVVVIMYDLINVLPRSNLQFLISAILFVTDCTESKLGQTG